MAIVPTLFRNLRIRNRLQGIAVFILLALVIAGPAVGGSERELRRDVITVIKGQMDAFRRDDGPGACAVAAPVIKRKFATPDTFMEMVRCHYGPVYRPQEVVFQDLRQSPRGPVQDVLLVGPDGQAVLAYYFMERQPDGSWKVAGVQLVPAPDLTT